MNYFLPKHRTEQNNNISRFVSVLTPDKMVITTADVKLDKYYRHVTSYFDVYVCVLTVLTLTKMVVIVWKLDLQLPVQ